jgi:hypothetical protein
MGLGQLHAAPTPRSGGLSSQPGVEWRQALFHLFQGWSVGEIIHLATGRGDLEAEYYLLQG